MHSFFFHIQTSQTLINEMPSPLTIRLLPQLQQFYLLLLWLLGRLETSVVCFYTLGPDCRKTTKESDNTFGLRPHMQKWKYTSPNHFFTLTPMLTTSNLLLLSFVFSAHTTKPWWSTGSLILIISLTHDRHNYHRRKGEGNKHTLSLIPSCDFLSHFSRKSKSYGSTWLKRKTIGD